MLDPDDLGTAAKDNKKLIVSDNVSRTNGSAVRYLMQQLDTQGNVGALPAGRSS